MLWGISVFICAAFVVLVECQDIEPRIVGGVNVSNIIGFKHQVSIRSISDDRFRFGSGHICGGSLINNKTVLTAAHCVHNKRYLSASNFIIAMGSLDRFVRDNNTLYIRASKIVGHKKFKASNFDNDIALILLEQEVPSNHPTVAPIPLAERPFVIGSSCRISGWGTTAFKNGIQPNRLQVANVTINSKSECNQPLRHNGNVLTGMFCAGSFYGPNIADSCQGDSGGPLECNGILTGIVSNGVECAKEGLPGVYIDVYHYRKWILAGDSSAISSNFATILIAAVLATLVEKF